MKSQKLSEIVFKDDYGFMLSVDPCETDPFKNGAYVANDEIEALVDFLIEDKQKKGNYEKELKEIGKKSLQNHPTARLVAEENNADNFCLFAHPIAYRAIMDSIVDCYDALDSDWLNTFLKEKNITVFSKDICREFWGETNTRSKT